MHLRSSHDIGGPVASRRNLVRALRSGALAAACIVGCASFVVPGRAIASEAGPGCLTVHVGPHVEPGTTASYFDIKADPGQTVSESLLVANPEPYDCSVELSAAYGKTATNSGDTYPPVAAGSCTGTSCWISGLPATVEVSANSRTIVPFDVRVPAATTSGQYLAGVLARPASTSSEGVPDPNRPGVGAVVLTSVGIGVAVTVAGSLEPLLVIPTVTLDVTETTPVLRIVEQDDGNTWEHPAGSAEIGVAGGATHQFGVESSTVLPGESATLNVPVAGIERGAQPTTVVLWYADHTKKAVWHGTLDYPKFVAPTPTAPPGVGAVAARSSATPTWIIVDAVGCGVVMLFLMAIVFFFVVGKRRRDDEEEEEGDEGNSAELTRVRSSVGSSD